MKLLAAARIFMLVLVLAPGCASQQAAQSAELSAFHSGNLKIPDKAEAPKLVYIDVHDSHKIAPGLAKNLMAALAQGKFRPADSPSKAGYILHVTILRQGIASQESLKHAVDSGYGTQVRFSGSGSRAILADAILTQRRVPSHKRPSHQKIKNISSRNALDSARMRVGIWHPGSGRAGESAMFSQALAGELAKGIK